MPVKRLNNISELKKSLGIDLESDISWTSSLATPPKHQATQGLNISLLVSIKLVERQVFFCTYNLVWHILMKISDHFQYDSFCACFIGAYSVSKDDGSDGN